MQKIIDNVLIECIQGDITRQADITAVVNAANARLSPGGGVSGAIHKVAGPSLYQECRILAPLKPGQAVITAGHKLPNRYCIHCLGPIYGVDKPEDKLLSDCYRNALLLAEDNKIDSIAFPAISTGVFGYPIHLAASTALKTIIGMLSGFKHLKKVRFVLYSNKDLKIHEETLSQLV
jgi:O-acetyl-ADP-ribose deacetylase (regulator of RNase III)